jgi:hypothetical protein
MEGSLRTCPIGTSDSVALDLILWDVLNLRSPSAFIPAISRAGGRLLALQLPSFWVLAAFYKHRDTVSTYDLSFLLPYNPPPAGASAVSTTMPPTLATNEDRQARKRRRTALPRSCAECRR